jgi:hypothetical protein
MSIVELCKGPCRGVVITDVHAPFTRMDVLDRGVKHARAYLKGAKPSVQKLVVLAGDTWDCQALSGYLSPEERAKLDWQDELENSLPIVQRLDSLRGRGVKVVELEGNHEDRSRRKGGIVDPAFRSSLEIDKVSPETGRIRSKWKRHLYTRDEGVVHVGGVCIMHGWASGTGGIEREVLRARLELARAGKAYPEVVGFRGHQHNLVPLHGGGPQPIRFRQVYLGVSVLSPGTWGPRTCGWDPRVNDSEWGAGLGLFEVDSYGRVRHAEVVNLD